MAQPGSSGAGTDPSRVIKGKKMPGQYGNVRHTAIGIRIEKIDAERNLIYLRGSVAGPTNGTVVLVAITFGGSGGWLAVPSGKMKAPSP